MKQFIVAFFMLAGTDSLLHAQENPDFNKTAQLIRNKIFSGDTAFYNNEKVKHILFYENGNIQIATTGNSDTLKFNLLLLHPLQLDSSKVYNQYGLSLNGNSLGLFVEETIEQDELNEKGETVVTRTVLPAYDISFADEASAKAVADALIRLMSYCKPDKNSFVAPRRY